MADRLNTIRRYFIELNLFDTKTDDQHLTRNEILSTRSYIIILLLLLSALTLFTILQSDINVVTLRKPTQKKYEELKSEYANSLQCPCKQISTSYEEFLNITVRYNEVCLSDFVTQKWIDYLFYENTSYYFQLDFRHDASARFQLLRTLCQQAQTIINDSLNAFYLLQFTTNQLVSADEFDVQANAFVDYFKRTTSPSFLNLIKLIRETTISNGLFSAIETGLVYGLHPSNLSRIYLDNIYYYENTLEDKLFDCYCDEYTACQMPEGIYTSINVYDFAGSDWIGDIDRNATTAGVNATFLLPGIFAGCKPIESVMRSTDECLYEETCLNKIASYVNYSSTSINSFQILNQSQTKRNLTIETLANDLFVEDWIIAKSYGRYFEHCQPLFCQYNEDQQQSFLRIITTIISLYGGLRIVLGFIIPHIVRFIRKKKQPSTASRTVRLYMLFRSVMKSIVHMNIFTKHSPDEHRQNNGRLSTKLYFSVMFMAVIIFCTYISLETQSNTVFVYHPTRIQFQQLQNQSVNDLYCPCTKISTQYSQFITFDPTYHQICSSVFTSDLWYNAYEIWNIQNPCYYPSFANLASFYFSLMSTFCQSANETVLDGLTQFYALKYITAEVVLEMQFNSEVMSFIELFQTRIQNSFRGQWSLLQSVVSNNQLASARKTNFFLIGTPVNNTFQPYSNIITHDNCTCGTNPTCRQPVGLCIPTRHDYLVGMYISCYMVDSLLMSTTECLFDENCINIIKFYMLPTTPLYQILNALNVSETSQYETNETIGTIANNLFIEKWNEFYSYDNYFQYCKPSFCSYTIKERPNFVYIITKLIGVYGGLTVALQFLIPILVNILRRKRREESVNISRLNRLRLFIQSIKNKVSNLNWFQDYSTNIEKIRQQILTTRLYIIILIIIFCILVLYTSLNSQSITVTVSLTNSTQYQQLYRKYSSVLTCPCNTISFEYKTFIDLKMSYHSVCSSDFVTQQWFDYLYNDQKINEQNFYATASAQFQTLASLCKLTQDTINTSLTQFYSTKLISSEMISNETFQKQINSVVNVFQQTVPQTFKRTLDMVHELIHGNFYMSAYQTNWKFIVLRKIPYAPLYSSPMTYNKTCSCGTSSKCFQSASIDNSNLDGLLIGCYPFQSMLQSSLQCLYNQTCLNLILSSFGILSNGTTFQILTSINQYGIDEKVENMVDRLFVDQWNIQQSYENYYQQCQPTLCTYSYIQNFNTFHIVTTILGLYGGLTIVLRLIIPFFMHIIFRLFCRNTIHINQFSQTVDQDTLQTRASD